MAMNQPKPLHEFLKTAKQNHGAKIDQIILFGSYARGEATEESDIDVLIVGDVTLDELIDISFPLLLKYGVCISPHVITAKHLNYLEKEGYGFIKNVKKEVRFICTFSASSAPSLFYEKFLTYKVYSIFYADRIAKESVYK